VRTRLIDDALVAALAAGANQVLLLGAGYDCRALRIPGAARARFFEIDRAALLTAKRAQLGPAPAHVVDVAADLEQSMPDEPLRRAGFSPDARSFAIWEGVSNYLSRAAIETTLAWLGGGLDPDEVPALLERHGLDVDSDDSTEEIGRRLGTRGGAAFYRVVLSDVRGRPS